MPEHPPQEVRDLLRPYVTEVTRLLGERLEGVILYGSAARGEFLAGRSNLNVLLLVTDHTVEALRRYAKMHRRWSKENMVAPLVLTAAEIEETRALFPLEYLEIETSHVLLAGRDPFMVRPVDTVRLAWECVHQVQSHLIRLRERVIEAGARIEGEAMVLPLSLTALLPILRGVLRVMGQPPPATTEALLSAVEAALGLDTAVLYEIWRLKRGDITPGAVEIPRLVERYVAAVSSLAVKARQVCATAGGLKVQS